MTAIFCFSAQPADESTETSSGFCILFSKLIYPDYASYDPEIQEIMTESLTFVVRKTAHFTEYAVLGFLFYFYFQDQKYNFLRSVTATGLYACTDELHQLFVPGRSGQLRDVIIDTCGGICGALIAFTILCILYYLRNHKTSEKKLL